MNNKRHLWSVYRKIIKERDNKYIVFKNQDLSYINLWHTKIKAILLLSNCNVSNSNFRLSSIDINAKNCNFSNSNLNNFGILKFIECDLSNILHSIDEKSKFKNCTGLPTTEELMDEYFDKDENGDYIVYKCFGLFYNPHKNWNISAGRTITSTVIDENRSIACSYGINFSDREWVENNDQWKNKDLTIWECRVNIENVVAPYFTDGKFRCNELKLVKIVYLGSDYLGTPNKYIKNRRYNK